MGLALALFCGAPLVILAALVTLVGVAGPAVLDQSLGVLPVVWIVVPALSMAALAIFLAHFEDAVSDLAAWTAILSSMTLTIVFFAFLHQGAGVICTAPVCPGTIAIDQTQLERQPPLGVEAPALVVHDPEDGTAPPSRVAVDQSLGTALYFSTVTFTTLGYGDFQPLPRLRVLAGYQAILGYLFLGLFVGSAIDYLAKRRSPGGPPDPGADQQFAEQARATAEAARSEAEAARQSAETAREKAEEDRRSAERQRAVQSDVPPDPDLG